MMTDVLEALTRKAQAEVVKQAKSKEIDATAVISYEALFRPWTPGKYEVNDIRTHKEQVWRCCQEHDNANNPDIEPGTHPAQWVPYHSKTKKWAKPFIQPQMREDAYMKDEYMIFTDGKTYRCKADYNTYTPENYPDSWEMEE